MVSIATRGLHQDSPSVAKLPVRIARWMLPQGNVGSQAGPLIIADTATRGLRQDSPSAAEPRTNATTGAVVEASAGCRPNGKDGCQ